MVSFGSMISSSLILMVSSGVVLSQHRESLQLVDFSTLPLLSIKRFTFSVESPINYDSSMIYFTWTQKH